MSLHSSRTVSKTGGASEASQGSKVSYFWAQVSHKEGVHSVDSKGAPTAALDNMAVSLTVDFTSSLTSCNYLTLIS